MRDSEGSGLRELLETKTNIEKIVTKLMGVIWGSGKTKVTCHLPLYVGVEPAFLNVFMSSIKTPTHSQEFNSYSWEKVKSCFCGLKSHYFKGYQAEIFLAVGSHQH